MQFEPPAFAGREHRVLHVLQSVTVAGRLVVQRDGPGAQHRGELDPGDEGAALRAVAATAVQARRAGQPGEQICHPGHGSEAAPLGRRRSVLIRVVSMSMSGTPDGRGWWGLARTS